MTATAALLIWPFITMAIFAGLGPARGLIWACLIGYLFLPEWEAFDLPALPAYNKYTVISLSLVLGLVVSMNKAGPKPVTTDKTMRTIIIGLMVCLFLGLIGTVFDNTSPIVRYGRFQQGHSVRDLISLFSETLITLVPFLLARRYLTSPDHHREVLIAFVVLGLVYSLLVLFEARMSPQLNRWVYDFFPHSWRQHIRGGGFRPIVFLGHGLSVGFFLMAAVLAAFAMVRDTTGKPRLVYVIAGVWLFLVLVLSRNLGATLLAFAFFPLLLILGRRLMILAATAGAILFMLYPVARASLPTEQFVSAIATISADRAQSMSFRLKHEGQLVERAMQKPVFGWGGWGRNRVVDERGRDQSVTDGAWIIQLGTYGWVGYIAYFGLVAAPIYFLRRRRDVSYASVGLAAILSCGLIYCLPNAAISPQVWLAAGALAGLLQFGPRGVPEEDENPAVETADLSKQLVYSRFAPKNRGTRHTRFSRNL